MPITLRHDSPGLALHAAYASGQQHGYDRMHEHLTKEQQLRLRQDRQALRSRVLDERQQLRRDRFEAEEQQRIQEGLQSGALYYTPEQAQERTRLQRELASLQTADDWDEPGRQAATEAIQRKLDQIRPLQRPADERPKSIGDQVQGAVHWDGGEWGKGTPWVVDPKSGTPQVARGWKPPEPEGGLSKDQLYERRSSLRDKQREYAKKLRTATKPGDPSAFLYDNATIQKMTEEAFAEDWQELNAWASTGQHNRLPTAPPSMNAVPVLEPPIGIARRKPRQAQRTGKREGLLPEAQEQIPDPFGIMDFTGQMAP